MPRPKQRTPAQLQAICEAWNEDVPVGAEVKYHHVIGEEAHTLHKTKTKAQVLSGHTPVVWLEGVPGCVALEACEPMEAVPTVLDLMARVIYGLQVPLSIGAPLGEAKEAYTLLRTKLGVQGWATVSEVETLLRSYVKEHRG